MKPGNPVFRHSVSINIFSFQVNNRGERRKSTPRFASLPDSYSFTEEKMEYWKGNIGIPPILFRALVLKHSDPYTRHSVFSGGVA